MGNIVMSKRVYIAGSFKNLDRMKKVRDDMINAGIETIMSEPQQVNGIDGCLERIRKADIIYILNYGGYVGKSVAMDIGYALALEKPIYAIEPIKDPDITHFLMQVVSPEYMVKVL